MNSKNPTNQESVQWVEIPPLYLDFETGYYQIVCREPGKFRTLGQEFVIPQGWTSDGITVPWYGRVFVPLLGNHLRSALIHDFFLQKNWPRKVARKAMNFDLNDLVKNNKTPWWRAFLMSKAVLLYDLLILTDIIKPNTKAHEKKSYK